MNSVLLNKQAVKQTMQSVTVVTAYFTYRIKC